MQKKKKTEIIAYVNTVSPYKSQYPLYTMGSFWAPYMYYRNFTAHMIDCFLKQKSNRNKKKNGETPKDPDLKEPGHSNRQRWDHDIPDDIGKGGIRIGSTF